MYYDIKRSSDQNGVFRVTARHFVGVGVTANGRNAYFRESIAPKTTAGRDPFSERARRFPSGPRARRSKTTIDRRLRSFPNVFFLLNFDILNV